LRCWPGCQAIILKGDVYNRALRGEEVTVIERLLPGSVIRFDDGEMYQIDSTDAWTVQHKDGSWGAFADTELMPISPPPDPSRVEREKEAQV
jgi:hypothetical protein